jgi:exodeoxyribonuclease VII large subunit
MSESIVGNVREYTVSELAGAVKRRLEDDFGLVRVRGELGRVLRHNSGHVYLDLKDNDACISGVVWRGTAMRLRFAPEQGMEVVATGRLSTFPAQSKYQLIVDSLEPAGVGALMALFEERKKRLAAEGLFAPERKKKLPFLPEVVGVVTSPSGAVIRDILHRLRERFPRRVLVWPTPVQGKGAELKIAAAIEGFNALPQEGSAPRPDVLIVARGGGSLEDLWCFNEEVVARAAAASAIPLISGVGHETDTTLIDYVADRRAPTPTAAAEMAVPVRSELLAEVLNKHRRLARSAGRAQQMRGTALQAAIRGLGRPEDVVGPPAQRLDRAGDLLRRTARARFEAATSRLQSISGRFGKGILIAGDAARAARLVRCADRLEAAERRLVADRRRDLSARRLPRSALARLHTEKSRAATALSGRFAAAQQRNEDRRSAHFYNLVKMLESLSHKSVLKRGFTLVRDAGGRLLERAAWAKEGEAVSIVFADGERKATIGDGAQRARDAASPRPLQKSLFD